MKVSAVIETIDSLNGVTGEQIMKLRKTAEGKPILRNFNSAEPPLGVIRRAYMRNGALCIEADWTGTLLKESFFLVPMHTSEYELLACGTTLHPMNRDLTPAQIVFSEDSS